MCLRHPDELNRFGMRSKMLPRNMFKHYLSMRPEAYFATHRRRHFTTHVLAWRRYRGGRFCKAPNDVLQGLKQPLYNLSSSPSEVIRRKRHPRWASSIRLSVGWGGLWSCPSLPTRVATCEQDNSKAAREVILVKESCLIELS